MNFLKFRICWLRKQGDLTGKQEDLTLNILAVGLMQGKELSCCPDVRSAKTHFKCEGKKKKKERNVKVTGVLANKSVEDTSLINRVIK